MKLQKPQFSFLTAVEADVLFPAGLCAVLPALWQFPRPGSTDPSKLLAPRSVLVGIRTAQQGCAETGSAGFGTGVLQGSGTRGKIPHFLSCASLPPLPFSPFPWRGFVESADHRAFFFFPTLFLHSKPPGVCFCCVASCLLHLNTVRVLRLMF